MTISKRTEQAAHTFASALVRDERRTPEIMTLIEAAFTLYRLEYNGSSFDIRNWDWPRQVFVAHTASISDLEINQPWTVLLQRAAELAETMNAIP